MIQPIDDFNDFNYERIAFDIRGVDKEQLRKRLKADFINHLWELDNADFIAIWNCDLQGFKRECDIFFESDGPTYEMFKLVIVEDIWYRIPLGTFIEHYQRW